MYMNKNTQDGKKTREKQNRTKQSTSIVKIWIYWKHITESKWNMTNKVSYLVYIFWDSTTAHFAPKQHRFYANSEQTRRETTPLKREMISGKLNWTWKVTPICDLGIYIFQTESKRRLWKWHIIYSSAPVLQMYVHRSSYHLSFPSKTSTDGIVSAISNLSFRSTWKSVYLLQFIM